MRCKECDGRLVLSNRLENKKFFMCLNCLFLVDDFSYRNINEIQKMQATQGDLAHIHQAISKEKTENDILARKRLIDSVIKRLNTSLLNDAQLTKSTNKKRSILDFGGSAGLTLFACENDFGRVNVVDLNDEYFEAQMAILGFTERKKNEYRNKFLISGTDWSRKLNDSVDIVFSWHVLEHFPKQSDFFNQIIPVLKLGGFILIQVPMLSTYGLRNQTHFVYHNGASIRLLFERNGFRTVDVRFDEEKQYLTYLGCLERKEKESIAIEKLVNHPSKKLFR